MIVSFPRVDGVSMISVAIKVIRPGHTLMLTALRSTLVHTLKKKEKMKSKSLSTVTRKRKRKVTVG